MKTNYWLIWILAAALAGCSPTEKPRGCDRDADCDPGFFCSSDHICLCVADNSCAKDEFCNVNGYCQKYLGCRVDADCGETGDYWRCEITASGEGRCLCRTNEACDDGEFCNTSGNCQTKAGCILDSDCGPAEAWRCHFKTDIGECLCQTDAACEEAEFCNVHGYCQPSAACEDNEDCQAGRYCNVATGECLCNPDAQTGCEAGEVCNTSGYCQPRPGCYDNDDCADLPETYCDFTTRTCVPNDSCTSDLQCPLGTICRQYECVDGCNDGSDCPLDEYCNNFQCTLGCQQNDFCGFAEMCLGGSCQSAYSAQSPYCIPCENSDLLGCGTRDNLCLIYPYQGDPFDQEYPFPRQPGESAEYCAPHCTDDEDCPNGFQCSSVISVKQSDICTTNAECPAGLPCLKSPEEDTGYCPCTAGIGNACPVNTCFNTDFCVGGSCWTLGMAGIQLACSVNTDCNLCLVTMDYCMTNADCRTVTCELYEGEDYGGCVSGQGCGLLEGVHCPPPSEWP